MRVLETHHFGAHTISVVEQFDDELIYTVLVDGHPTTDTPLPAPPSFENVVRLYAQWQMAPDKPEPSRLMPVAEEGKGSRRRESVPLRAALPATGLPRDPVLLGDAPAGILDHDRGE